MKPEKPASWLHSIDCGCDRCAPPAAWVDDRLTAVRIAMLAFTGFIAGAGLSALYDPPATLTSLAAIVGVGL